MNWDELRARQQKCIQDAMELLDTSFEESFVLLRKHGWDLERLQEGWFHDPEEVLRKSGLGPSPPAAASSGSLAS